MNIFSGLEKIVEKDFPLADYTWYGLGGKADYFIKPATIEELQESVLRCIDNDLPIRVIGFGSNLLVSDKGVKGAVIKLQGQGFSEAKFDGEILTAGAGADVGELIRTCVRKGLSGLEALTGIPGSVGGAVRMNAGGNFGDLGSVVETVTLMDDQGNIYDKSKPELMFDYRSTNISATFILGAQIKLNQADQDQIMRTVKEIWIYKKNSQPLNTKNAGCVFKNPRGVSAGALIDRAGLKGHRIGGAVVSEKHANFIIAEKDCKSSDVLKLIEYIKDRVRQQHDIELELEIEIWN